MRTLYIYENSDLPEQGWLQCCVTCFVPTSNTVLYEFIKKKHIYSYICKKCKKKCDTDTKYKNYYNECCVKLKMELTVLCC